MTFITIIILIVFALIFTFALIFGLNRHGPWRSAWTVFVIVLFGMWAASLWVNPAGPVFYNVSWVPLAFVGLVITLLLAAATPEDSKKFYTKSISDEEDKASQRSATIFFWLFIVALGLIIIFGYWR